MTINDRHIVAQTDFMDGRHGLNQQCKWTKIEMTDKKDKGKSPRFAFLKISASAHCTHLQSRTGQPTTQALQKSAILPTL